MVTMEELFATADQEGLMLHCAYQDMWFTSDELRADQANGKFRWGPVNWELRPASDRTRVLEKAVISAQKRLDAWVGRVAQGVIHEA